MTGFDFSNHVTMLLDLQIVAVKVNSFIQESFFHSSQIISGSDAMPHPPQTYRKDARDDA